MPSRIARTIARAAALALTLLPALAHAALRDHGPVSPQTGYPAWYRDSAGAALELCLAQTPSPNASAGGAPMCFPWVTDPAGFPGNLGEEQFYMSAGATLAGGPGFSALLDLALEAAYATGTPVRGQEIVFARVRIRIDTPVAGTYRVVHPYGVEVFGDVDAGTRAINFTQDVGVAPGDFAGALDGAVGPFLRWDVLDLDPASGVPFSLTVSGPDGVEEYLGDPNVAHTVTGSPFGTNYFLVEGPPGSNLDGQGNDFALTPLFSVVGKRYLQPIPTFLAIDRAVYGHDGQNLQLDVFASSEPGVQLVASAPGLPSFALAGDGAGRYFGHLVVPAAGRAPPATVTVTNLTDVPSAAVTAQVVDAISIWSASYDTTTGILDVAAYSSDTSDPAAGPALDVLGLGAGPMSPSEGNATLRTVAVPVAAPPPQVTVVSSAGGLERERVKVLSSAPTDPTLAPVAVPDEASTLEDLLVPVPVLSNDAPSLATVILLGAPANGAAAVNAITGAIDYAPRANWSGTDTFSYMIQDAAGLYSNPASITVTVAPVNDAPAAANDVATTAAGVAKVIAVLANDADVDGAIVPGTVAIAGTPVGGTATANPDGTVTFTPDAGAGGTATFAYTVSDAEGAVSNAATVTVTVTNPEQLATSRVQYEVAKRRWRVDGTSTVFGPSVANTVTFHNGPTTDYPVIGTAAIDATGAFQWQPAPGTVPAPDATRRLTLRSSGGGQITATVTLR